MTPIYPRIALYGPKMTTQMTPRMPTYDPKLFLGLKTPKAFCENKIASLLRGLPCPTMWLWFMFLISNRIPPVDSALLAGSKSF